VRSASLSEIIASDYRISAEDSAALKALAVQEVLQRGIFEDEKAREIESYALTLQSQANWNSVISLDGVSIDTCSSSKYSSNTTVIRAQMTFEPRIRLSYVLALVENPNARAMWDGRLQHMSVVYVAEGNYYVKNTVLVLASPVIIREYVEKCQIREVGTELRLAYYSINDPVKVILGLSFKRRDPESKHAIWLSAAANESLRSAFNVDISGGDP
jgi:hypothetical protein